MAGLKIKTKPSAPQAEVTVTQKEKGVTLAENTEQISSEELQAAGIHGITAHQGMSVLEAALPFCQVGYELSYTHNLGDFKSTRANVSIVIPCEHDEIEGTFDFAKEWVEERINKFAAEFTGEGGEE